MILTKFGTIISINSITLCQIAEVFWRSIVFGYEKIFVQY